MRYGELFIIPNENKLKIPNGVFYRQVNVSHLMDIQEFVGYYNLGYQFKNDEYQEAPYCLAKDGHLVVKTIDDPSNFICYIPELVTDDQYMWFYQKQEFINKYDMVGAYCIKNDNNSYEVKIVDGIDDIMKVIQKRNILYQRYMKDVLKNKSYH